MKQVLATLIFLLVTTLRLYAQEADTTKIEIPSKQIFQLKDSLLQDKKSLKIDPFLPKYNDLGKLSADFTNSQTTFSLNRIPKRTSVLNVSYSKFIIPTAMISYGLITRGSKSLQELDHSTHNEIGEHLQDPIPIDDYSQYAPAAAVYGLDLIGVKAKHNFRDRTIIMTTSYIIMGMTVQTMKGSINIERPDNSNNHSFPSGHTATAFVGAHILFKEYKDVSPWIGVAGYAIATGTSTLRVLNKRHWISDVVTGAGIGILSAEVGYMLLPVFHNMFGIKNKNNNLAIAPVIGIDNYGIGMVYAF
jgi:Membrane-associated phospholipid phosphatase